MSRTTAYREFEEISAPFDLPGSGIKEGDRDVVVEEFGAPIPAILVEHADGEGQTRALVIYTPDLGRILEVILERGS